VLKTAGGSRIGAAYRAVTARAMLEQIRTEILQMRPPEGGIASRKAEKSARRRIERGVTTADMI
jgi:hypothetical protein